jgi:hypothetical protein
MDEFTTTSDNLDQTDEAILFHTVSDEAIEAAGIALMQTIHGLLCSTRTLSLTQYCESC